MPPISPENKGQQEEDYRAQLEFWRRTGQERQTLPYEGIEFTNDLEAERRIELAEDIDFKRLEKKIDIALAYEMGRLYELSDYILTPEGLGKDELDDLIGLFCTVEQSRDRPRTQIKTAMEHATKSQIKRINEGQIKGWDQVSILDLFGIDKNDADQVDDFRNSDEGQTYFNEVEKWKERTGKDREEMAPEDEEKILKRVVKLRLKRIYRRAIARYDISMIDHQRLLTADNADSMVNLVLSNKDPWWRDEVTPDATTWRFAFVGEEGDKVDAILREIEKKGREGFKYGVDSEGEPLKINDPYAKLSEFTRPKVFQAWIKPLYELSGQRMDIVLRAWHLARAWGVTGELGYTTKERKNQDVYYGPLNEHLGKADVVVHQIGDSPMVSDFETWAMHTLPKLASEYGLTTFDQIENSRGGEFPFLTALKTTKDQHISHSGLPYHYHPEVFQEISESSNMGLYPSYMKWAKVDVSNSELSPEYRRENNIPEKGKTKVSLYQMWTGEATTNPVKLAELPWNTTAMTVVEADEPLPAASYGLWDLYKTRTLTVVKKLLRGVPSLNDLLNREWWEDSQWRHFKKVVRVDDDTLPEKNLRTRVLHGWLLAFQPTPNTDEGLIDYHYVVPSQHWGGIMPDKAADSAFKILLNAYRVGVIGRKDYQWIVERVARLTRVTQAKDIDFFFREDGLVREVKNRYKNKFNQN